MFNWRDVRACNYILVIVKLSTTTPPIHTLDNFQCIGSLSITVISCDIPSLDGVIQDEEESRLRPAAGRLDRVRRHWCLVASAETLGYNRSLLRGKEQDSRDPDRERRFRKLAVLWEDAEISRDQNINEMKGH